MILDEPWAIAADRHRSGKATIVLNMFKTVVASLGAAPSFLHSYGSRSTFLRIRAAVVEAFVAFREESSPFVVRFSYGLVITISVRTVWSRLVYDLRDDASTISGDVCTVLQEITTIVLRLPCLRSVLHDDRMQNFEQNCRL